MTVATRKSNSTAHPGAPDLPTTTRRSSKEVATQRRAAKCATREETRLALEQVHAVAALEEKMRIEDALEQVGTTGRPTSETDDS
jgi:hypothetical protein